MNLIENTIPLFSTPLYFVENEGDTFKFNELQLNFLKQCEYVHMENNCATKYNQLLNLPVFSDLKKFVENHIQCYTKKFIDGEYYFDICSSWATKTQTGQSHNFHKHLTSVISGIVNVTPNNTTIFSRESQGPFPFFSFEYKNSSLSFAEKVSIVQKNSGCILLFPSNVFHAVAPHTLEEDRYAISFNVFARGNFYNHPEQTIV